MLPYMICVTIIAVIHSIKITQQPGTVSRSRDHSVSLSVCQSVSHSDIQKVRSFGHSVRQRVRHVEGETGEASQLLMVGEW